MGIYNRADGKIITTLPNYVKFFPFIMPTRIGASIYFTQKIVLDKTLDFCDENNVKLFHIFIAALKRLGDEKPVFNRFVVGKRVYQRNHMAFSFMAKKELTETSTETNVKVFFDDQDNLKSISEKIAKQVQSVKKGEYDETDHTIETLTSLPKWITTFIFYGVNVMNHFGLLSRKFIDDNPLFSSAYLTNVGSIGLEAPFHHMYEFGTTSLFASLGKIHEEVLVVDGQIITAKIVHVNFTIDERIADGIYMAKALNDFVYYMENPEVL
ncbi:MAG: 2-oxo acid dehydrogenase subunit E2 [Clostridia bacterium]|nr:2-oxo acid dehydrogenase subunit E2 [Clostridia bacterium]